MAEKSHLIKLKNKETKTVKHSLFLILEGETDLVPNHCVCVGCHPECVCVMGSLEDWKSTE